MSTAGRMLGGCWADVGRIVSTAGRMLVDRAQWGAIYKTLYESLLDFVNCLEMVQNKEIKMTYLLGVSGAFQTIYTFQRSKLRNRLKRPGNTQNTTTIR